VVVNLRVDAMETRVLGVENHVCEVQLVLAAFADVEVRRAETAAVREGIEGGRASFSLESALSVRRAQTAAETAAERRSGGRRAQRAVGGFSIWTREGLKFRRGV
jgi:hypothetical protein